jgi:hypothetical protein
MSQEKKEYIEGIYNYCDRWCEKCKFTANCLLFTQESKINTYEILHNGDMTGIEEVFDREIERLEKEHEDDEDNYGDYIDDEFFSSDEEEDEKFWEDEEKMERPKHPIDDLLDEYFDKSHSLIKSLNAKYNFLDVPKDNLKDPVAQKTFNDFEIFMWYHTFIGAKIKRALFGLDDIRKEDDDEIKEIHAYDMNGSAKIGIISIRRSINALNNLHKTLPVFSAEIEEVLVLIGKILNLAEGLFPVCMNFKRPGLDD